MFGCLMNSEQRDSLATYCFSLLNVFEKQYAAESPLLPAQRFTCNNKLENKTLILPGGNNDPAIYICLLYLF